MAGELARVRGNVKISGLQSWGIKLAANTGVSFLSTLYGKNGKVLLKTLDGGKPDWYGRPRAASWGFEAQADFPMVKTLNHGLSLLGSLSSNDIEHRILTRSGRYFNSKATGLPGTFGMKWSLIADKSMDDNMYLHVEARRNLTQAEYTLLLASAVANPALVAADPGDTFYGFTQQALSDVAVSGLRSIHLGAGVDEIGVKEKGTFKAELLTDLDDDGQDESNDAVRVTMEVNAKQTADTEMSRYNTLIATENVWSLSFASGLLFTPPAGGLGLMVEYRHDNDSDKNAFVKASVVGILTPAEFAAAWTLP
jgi:hypothetical protein